MGKIRVKTIGNEEQEAEEKKKAELKKAEKKARLAAASKDVEESKEEEKTQDKKDTEPQTQETEPASNAAEAKVKKKMLKKKADNKAFHSKKYEELSSQVDKSKVYSLSEGLELLKKLQRTKFDETVELHINTVTPGVSGSVTLPHGTGKKTRVVVADDKVLAEIEKGVINFDILVATPSFMPKLAKVARVLGPKGLMPNPKNGTITEKPEDVAKKYEGGQINFKTESKNPLMHLTVGKISFGTEKLAENIQEMLKAVKKSNIVNVTLKSTMSPGIKIKI